MRDFTTCSGVNCPMKSGCSRVTNQLELFHIHLDAPWNRELARCDFYSPIITATGQIPLPQSGCCSN